MTSKAKYFIQLHKRFGLQAVLFLLESKFLRKKLINRKIKELNYPIFLSNYGPDVMTLFQIFYAKEYAISESIAPRFIIDCGANIGLSAVYYAHTYPDSRIIALEPDTENFMFLKKNTAFYPNVTCVNKAIWSHPATMEIVDNGSGNWGFQTIETNEVNGRSVHAIGISELIEQYSIDTIDILKIDIEGAEKELFKTEYEAWLPRTKIIAIELHDNLDKEISAVFYKALGKRKYKKYYNGENLICDFR